MSYVLLLFLYTPSVAVPTPHSIAGFKSKEDCEMAGKDAKKARPMALIEFVCLKQ